MQFFGRTEPIAGAWTHLGILAAAGAGKGFGAWAPAALSGGSVQGRECAGEHAPVRRRASGGHRDPSARDGEARRGAEHALGEAPQASAGAGHALQQGALDVHYLVAEGDQQQAHLVAREGVHPLLPLPDLLAPVVALAARRGRQGRDDELISSLRWPSALPRSRYSATASMAGSAKRFSTALLRTRAT